MRMFMLPMMLVCSLSSATQNMPQELYTAMTGFDYGILISASSLIMEKYSDRIRTILLDENNHAQLETTSDEESFELTIAMSCFLLAFVRMKQEIACLEDAERPLQELYMLWEQVVPVFGLIPEQVQETAKRLVVQILISHEDKEAEWAPRAESELPYVEPAKWTAIRQAVARDFYTGSEQLMIEE